jgi:hypothetical protein
MLTRKLAGEKKVRASFTTEFKQNVVNFYNICKSKHRTAVAFKIDRTNVILWMKEAADKVDSRLSGFFFSRAFSRLPVHFILQLSMQSNNKSEGGV